MSSGSFLIDWSSSSVRVRLRASSTTERRAHTTKAGHRHVDPRQAEPRSHARAGPQGEQPQPADEREDQAIERHVDGRRHGQLDRVERREPEHGDEPREHPRQDAGGARPVVGVAHDSLDRLARVGGPGDSLVSRGVAAQIRAFPRDAVNLISPRSVRQVRPKPVKNESTVTSTGVLPLMLAPRAGPELAQLDELVGWEVLFARERLEIVAEPQRRRIREPDRLVDRRCKRVDVENGGRSASPVSRAEAGRPSPLPRSRPHAARFPARSARSGRMPSSGRCPKSRPREGPRACRCPRARAASA